MNEESAGLHGGFIFELGVYPLNVYRFKNNDCTGTIGYNETVQNKISNYYGF